MARAFRHRRPDGGSGHRTPDGDAHRGIDAVAGDPRVKVTQTYVEVADSSKARLRVTQFYAEVAVSSAVGARVTQFYAEVADSTAFPPEPEPEPDIPPSDPGGDFDATGIWTILT